jgi:hypothetical protein
MDVAPLNEAATKVALSLRIIKDTHDFENKHLCVEFLEEALEVLTSHQ